jgi:hypothetical protein
MPDTTAIPPALIHVRNKPPKPPGADRIVSALWNNKHLKSLSGGLQKTKKSGYFFNQPPDGLLNLISTETKGRKK